MLAQPRYIGAMNIKYSIASVAELLAEPARAGILETRRGGPARSAILLRPSGGAPGGGIENGS